MFAPDTNSIPLATIYSQNIEMRNAAIKDCAIWLIQNYGTYKPEFLAMHLLDDLLKDPNEAPPELTAR